MAALSDELANTANDQGLRQQAGIQLKNCLISKSEAETEQRLAAWISFPDTVRAHIKQRAMQTLGTEMGASQAAGVIAAIARAEFPKAMWPELMATLVGGATSPQAPERARVAALKCIGYICENDDDSLQQNANQILNGVTTCMREEETSEQVKLEAITSLELAWAYGVGGYKGKANWYADKDAPGGTSFFKAMPAPLNAPWDNHRSELRVYDVPMRTADDLAEYLKR